MSNKSEVGKPPLQSMHEHYLASEAVGIWSADSLGGVLERQTTGAELLFSTC